jgi:hypothetical protein
MKILTLSFLLLLISFSYSKNIKKRDNESYIIEEPGTITFTSGVKIKGKVAKPQVMIFMTKDKSYTREVTFDYSFKEKILKPLNFVPYFE